MNGDWHNDLAAHLRHRCVAVAESCTGGLVAESIARMKGSGDWFRGGVVAYQPETKFRVLGVTRGPVVTESAAEEMARGVAALLEAEAAVGVTGAAGPEPHDGAPPGTVIIAVLVDDRVATRAHHFDGTPEQVCAQARDAALRTLSRMLEAE
jgi:nicotinamide-nucleotide amidase